MAGNNYRTPLKKLPKTKKVTHLLASRRSNPRLGGIKARKRALVGK